MELQFPTGLMTLLVLSTVFIAAGGYAINDYFDRKIDLVNKPDKVIIGRLIHTRHVMAYHLFFTITGVLMGVWTAYRSGLLFLSLIFIIVSGMLWFYSTTYKRQLLLGTFIVAILTALVPFVVYLFEIPLVLSAYGSEAKEITGPLLIWVLGFSVFAFLLNLSREIVKDTEDFEGDHAFGKQTLPVVIGIRNTKIVTSAVILLVIALLLMAFFLFVPDKFSLVFFIVLLIIPLLVVAGIIWKSETAGSFHLASVILKMIMLAGVLYMILVNILVNKFS